MAALRIAYIVRDEDLRIVSSVVRAGDFSNDVHVIDLGSKDRTRDLAVAEGCTLHELHPDASLPEIAAVLKEEGHEGPILAIRLDSNWKLRDLPVAVNRAKEGHDVHLVFAPPERDVEPPAAEELTYADAPFQRVACSPAGLIALSSANPLAKPLDLPRELDVRVVRHREPIPVPQRESLATASRFAQLFYWMLESKHPLLAFGIPGVILFSVGYLLSRDVIDTFDELTSVSLGVALATFVVTIIGLLAMMAALTLYILGKQVKQIQLQYQDWPQN